MGNGFNFSDTLEQEEEDAISAKLDNSSASDPSDLIGTLFQEERQLAEERNVVMTERERRVAEAKARVEHANLYITILNSNIFAPGSARPEIQDRVEEEFKAFAGERLSELLGMRKDKPKDESFSGNEMKALKLLASKVLPKMSQEQLQEKKDEEKRPTPKINVIAGDSSMPKLQAKKTVGRPPQISTKQTNTPTLSKTISEMSPQEAMEEVRRRKSQKKAPSGRSPDAPKPLPMPGIELETLKASQDVAMMKNNEIVEKITRSSKSSES